MTENLTIVVNNLVFKKGQSGGFFSDPAFYCKLLFGGDTHKTKTAYGNATDPEFDLTVDLGAADQDDKIILQVHSEGTFSDDFVGECNIFIDSLKVGKGKKDGFTVLKETSSIGVVFITSTYTAPEQEEEAPEETPETPPPTIA